MSFPAWMPRLIDGARLALEFILVIAVAWLLAKVAWLVIAPGPAVSELQPRPLPTPVRQASDTSVRADLSVLMTTNPFEAAASGEIVPTAPTTQLNLKLVALFMSTEDGRGSATIVTPDNQTTRFELGDEILPRVRLERILSDRVIISRDGKEETLMRSGREAGLSVIGDPDTAQTNPGRASAPAPTSARPGVSAATLLANLDVTPESADGVVTAIILRPRGDATIMQSAGLQAGDRLTELNGTNVSEIDPAFLSAELSSASRITMTVIRNGEAIPLEIEFDTE